MRGSIAKKGKRYYVITELPPDPITGKRRQKWHSGYGTKRDAERALTDLLSKQDRGEYVEPSKQTLEDFLEEWLPAIAHTIRASTLDSYARNMRNHVIPYLGSTPLSKVDPMMLNGLYGRLLQSGRRRPSRTGRGYSPDVVERAQHLRADGLSLTATAEKLQVEFAEASHITKDTLASLLRRQTQHRAVESLPEGLSRTTVNYVHTILHRAFKDAVRWGRLARNPADAADPPRAQPRTEPPRTWTPLELKTFFVKSAESGDRLHALWVLLATTGMRRGEALGLRWIDVDFDDRRADVIQTITQTRGRVAIGAPKTFRGRRSVSLDHETISVLRQHRVDMLEERLIVGPDFSDEGLIFHKPDGSCLKPDAVSAQFVRRTEQYGLPRIPPHNLRHTWATLALEQRIPIKVVQERLGHAHPSITMNIYSHVGQPLHEEAASVIAGLFLTTES